MSGSRTLVASGSGRQSGVGRRLAGARGRASLSGCHGGTSRRRFLHTRRGPDGDARASGGTKELFLGAAVTNLIVGLVLSYFGH